LHLLEAIDAAPGELSEYGPSEEWPTVCGLCRHRDELHSHQQKLPIREMIRAYEERASAATDVPMLDDER
jgi:hypothetical protein